ncbi:hypothetical protein V496_02144 [Pseudogymnoascus sp. VKM F-4515 (FW-2607)]|nr:hypothetical protein V496_02144 [Pseudogymnoascus sp. VKM F-4515 (FW-2607)]
MESWPEHVARHSYDDFWMENEPVFHAYDYGANIEIEVSEGVQRLGPETRLRPREDTDDEADADSEHDQRSAAGGDDSQPRSVRGEGQSEGGQSEGGRSVGGTQAEWPLEPKSTPDGLYSDGLTQLATELDQKYELDHISSISYALAVDLNCLDADDPEQKVFAPWGKHSTGEHLTALWLDDNAPQHIAHPTFIYSGDPTVIMEEHRRKVRQMLGGKPPSEFIKLPITKRQEVIRRFLVKEDDYVQIEEGDDDDFFNEEDIAQGDLLRQEYFMGDDEAGKQLVKEARQIYYAENMFTVRSHWLCEFVRDTLADGKPMAIEPLVRRIIVRVDVRHIHDMDNFTSVPEGETEKSWVVRDLRQLLEFKNAEFICIEVRGGGALDGSDLRTQQKIEEMSGIVKKLIMRFGEKLTIRKTMRRDDGQWTSHDMRPYWDKPTSMAKLRLPAGKVTFEELMQIQIEEWTRKISPIVRLNDYWESLLYSLPSSLENPQYYVRGRNSSSSSSTYCLTVVKSIQLSVPRTYWEFLAQGNDLSFAGLGLAQGDALRFAGLGLPSLPSTYAFNIDSVITFNTSALANPKYRPDLETEWALLLSCRTIRTSAIRILNTNIFVLYPTSDTVENYNLASKGGHLLKKQILRVEIGKTFSYTWPNVRSLHCERGVGGRPALLYKRSLEVARNLCGSFEVNLVFQGPLTESEEDQLKLLCISIENIAAESPQMPQPKVMILGQPDNSIQEFIRGLSCMFEEDCTHCWQSEGDPAISSVAGWTNIPGQKTNGLEQSDHLSHDNSGSNQGIGTRDSHSPMSTQGYRHIAIEIGREYVRAGIMRDMLTTEEMPHEDSDVVEVVWITRGKVKMQEFWEEKYKSKAIVLPPRENTATTVQHQQRENQYQAWRRKKAVVQTEVDEYARYLQAPILLEVKDALAWWLEPTQRLMYPNLSLMDIDILSIPAMSAEPERLFLLSVTALLTATDRRNNLEAETTEATECLKSWM